MKTTLLVSSLLAVVLASSIMPKKTIMDPSKPIYLGDVFWPPTMNFIAWLPNEQHDPTEWCYRATDVSNNKLFSLGGIDALQMHDYFAQNAYITREGKRYADCWITPESGRMGACEGVLDYNCEGGQKFTGPGTRRWSCWILESQRNYTLNKVGKVEEEKKEKVEAVLTKGGAVVTGEMKSSEILGAWTPGVTGS